MSGPDEPREPEGYDDAPPFRPARRPPLLHRTVPVAREVPHYRLATIRVELVAALADLATSLAGEGIVLHVARMKTPEYERLERADVADVIGPERFHPTVRAAVRAAASRTAAPAASA